MAGESYAIPPKDRAVEGILWYIQHYQLGGGDRLPAERVLCEEIGVSRTALRAGIMRLISCGTLESRRGSGTYVCPPKPLNIFQETYNFSDAVRTAGLQPSSRLVSTETLEADETLADKLGVAVDAPLLRMQRVRLIEGEPASIETAHVNLSLCPSLPEHDFECESLYDVLLKEGGVRVEHGREHISISRLNAEEAELLQQEEGTPVFYESTIEFDKDMRFVEHCKSVILPTKFRFADNGEKNGMRSVAGEQWLKQ